MTSTRLTPVTQAPPSTTIKSSARCVVEFGINYPGNDLISQEGVQTAYECCNLCSSNMKCAAWSYFISFNYCFLKSSAPSANNLKSKQPYEGIWSGVVVNS